MKDFFKRNLVWIAILLCVTGVVLSVIGIPTGKPVFFFIGIVLALPTIGYLIYQIFFYHDKPELNLAPVGAKFSTANITSIVADKADILLNDQSNNDEEDDLEPFYNGYASEEEINQRLHEVTNTERERIIEDLPEIDLPTARPNLDATTAIQNTTNDELLRQREAVAAASEAFSTEVPTDLVAVETPAEPAIEAEPETAPVTTAEEMIAEQSIDEITNEIAQSEYIAPSLDAPNFVVPTEPVMPQNVTPLAPRKLTPVDLSNTTIIHINAENAAKRKQKAEEKKNLLAQNSLERYLRRYYVETAACFLMDRTIYKDRNGIAPYNKFAVNKTNNLPEYTMSATKGKLYKFCAYLIDAERFITHQVLYDDFITAIEQGVSLARISETLHPIYRKKYKKDFVLNLSNREDWDNVIILVYNNYILDNDNFKDVFTRVPFEIPTAYSEDNVIDYLKDPDLQERFNEKYNALEEMGVPTFWEAYYICFINSIKQKLTIAQLESALLREYKKIARALKRLDAARRKTLRKAS